jgi:hypothetical protein
MLYGSVCLYATSPLKTLPQLRNPQSFRHTPHPQRGLVEIEDDGSQVRIEDQVHLPQRNKEFYLATYSGHEENARRVNDHLKTALPDMEAQFEASRQLYKFNRIQKDIVAHPKCQGFVSLIVNNGDHRHLAILSQWQDLHLYGVYDLVNSSVRLVWTDDEWFIQDVRSQDYTRYIFYRYPVVQDRPMFFYPQSLCSKWWNWVRQFQGPEGVLKAFNSLELFLYKEPELPSLKVGNGSTRPTE